MVEQGWQIIEALSYRASVDLLGGPRNCDEALAPVMYALHRNPLGFPEPDGIRGVRIAKTKIKITSDAVLPAMRLWFRASVATKTVELLYVELCPTSLMPYLSEDGA